MDRQVRPPEFDEVLVPLMKASAETESAHLMEQLIEDHALPVIKEVIRSRLRSIPRQDTEDIASDVVLQLVRRLRKLKLNPDGQSFPSFRSFVATVTSNTCYMYLRKKYPERSRLKSKLRYLLKHQMGLSIWERENHKWYCGFVGWRDQNASPCPMGRLHELRDDPASRLRAETSYGAAGSDLAESLAAIFNWLGGPIELNSLVDAIADLWQIADRPEADEDERETLVEGTASVADKFEQRIFLQRLWNEITDLPLDQRRALLLNLRDEHGRDLCSVISRARIASMRGIAQALAISPDEFARLWNQLPLDDATIARSLGVGRQRVINLRNAARKRLVRRMKDDPGRKN